MAEALGHPRLGYYRRARPLGSAGDFTTAPEISQMFGELIGAWLAERWLAMGGPSVALVELGPGRGTLMSDALRATRGVPGFHAALRLHLVETNTALCAEQRRALAAFTPTWHERFDDVPPGPMLLVANEFFDALPVRQFEKTPHGWRERMVGLAPDGESLMFALAPGVTPFARFLPDAADGAQAEISEAGRTLAAAIGARVRGDGGWALIVDYGYESGSAATLQAVRGHKGVDVLERPGETDLSAHVDFAALAVAAQAPTFGPVSQADFLQRLGLLRRAETLKARASEDQRREIDVTLARLIGPDQMGTLFRVIAVGDGRSIPAGFSDAS
ncbi:MAG: SAM-dependent methyltransferase [Proteobacteria bacterium]|nr:SAM-dependent methyltransferase [Pseudomonadota bacterium]